MTLVQHHRESGPDTEEPAWDILQFGTEAGRGLGRTVVARSVVCLHLPHRKAFQRCIKALREFSVILRGREENDVRYGWDTVYVSQREFSVKFDILWYDRAFFTKRHNAYQSTLHQRVFEQFDVTHSDFTIAHQDGPRSDEPERVSGCMLLTYRGAQ